MTMPVVTVKVSEALNRRLASEAERRRISKSAVLREAFTKYAGATKGTLAERARHLIGSIDGPGDLSQKSKTLAGYGRSRSR
jgi:hypothetical protein